MWTEVANSCHHTSINVIENFVPFNWKLNQQIAGDYVISGAMGVGTFSSEITPSSLLDT